MAEPGSTTTQLLQALASGEQTAAATVEAHLQAIEARDAVVGAFLHVDAEGARQRAADIDRRRADGGPLGRLAGIPIAIKDLVCTRDQPTTCASRMLESFRPPYDAHIIERLRAEDAILIGKVNLDEFAMGSSNENSAFRATTNPWNPECAPGGSSGGSAAAVAAGMVPLSVGSDTGGSIRQPASFCGVVGVKPTYGRVSRYGLIAFASSLDQIGPLANDVTGAALLLQLLSGHDARDSTSVPEPVPDYSGSIDTPLTDLRIGVLDHVGDEGIDDDVRSSFEAAMDVYRSLGAVISPVSLPHAKYCVATYYLIACSEASSNLARFDGVHYGRRAESFADMIDMYATSRGEGFGEEVKRRIMLGTYALSAGYYDAYYAKALKVRRLIREDFDQSFEDVDVIASPVSPTPAFRLGELIDDPLQMYLSDIFTISANLAGLPGISVPAGFSADRLPIGLQLLAPAFGEDRLLRAARMFEAATDWHTRRAPVAAEA